MQEREQAIVVGIRSGRMTQSDALESLAELKALVESAGAEVEDELFCDLDRITAATFIGTGKVEELRTMVSKRTSFIAVDQALSPAQQRNLEKITESKVIDRTGIILDIFAQRARTREGKIQVELAQLQYMLPRLTRLWQHLSRLGAGIGTRGPGETQLEVDRRKIRQRIDKLSEEFTKVRKRRRLQRHGRRRTGMTTVALVGYTNAGKSTLLNQLTGAHALVADRLFATLDPTIRALDLPNNRKIIMSDTVGFIKRLPHQLVEAFRATLEEVTEADLLLHVVDVSSETRDQQIEAVQSVLDELDALQKPTILVLNKSDMLEVPVFDPSAHPGTRATVSVSALTGEGCDRLIHELMMFEESVLVPIQCHFPYQRNDLVAAIQRDAEVISVDYQPGGVDVSAKIHPGMISRYLPYSQKETQPDAD